MTRLAADLVVAQAVAGRPICRRLPPMTPLQQARLRALVHAEGLYLMQGHDGRWAVAESPLGCAQALAVDDPMARFITLVASGGDPQNWRERAKA